MRRCVFWHTNIYDVLGRGRPPGSKDKPKSGDSTSHLIGNKKAKKANVSVSSAPSDTANSNTANTDTANSYTNSDAAHLAPVEACTSPSEAGPSSCPSADESPDGPSDSDSSDAEDNVVSIYRRIGFSPDFFEAVLIFTKIVSNMI